MSFSGIPSAFDPSMSAGFLNTDASQSSLPLPKPYEGSADSRITQVLEQSAQQIESWSKADGFEQDLLIAFGPNYDLARADQYFSALSTREHVTFLDDYESTFFQPLLDRCALQKVTCSQAQWGVACSLE
ncbi:MAG: hypothetical protein HC824_09090 [Synechococcales cyanobacterium RM1_1_8]|nr:hypothetical protein [Synechococcales cyanobacterium RM1_1_8]